jgi:hypothetical protein
MGLPVREITQRIRRTRFSNCSAQRFRGGDSVLCLDEKPFSFDRANARTKTAALDALVVGFLRGLF